MNQKVSLLIPTLLLALAAPATASTIAFEDEAVLPAGGWQLNTILQALPSTHRIEGGVSQEIRYGLTNRLMARTTVPLGFFREGNRSTFGIGDWEFFLKTLLMGNAESPFQAALGLQWILPSAHPSELGENRHHLTPSLMLRQDLPGGTINALIGYENPLAQEHTTTYGLGWHFDFRKHLNVVFEGLLTDEGSSQILTLGPGFTWSFAEGMALMASLQAPALTRGGNRAAPLFGLLQFSRDF